VTINGGSGPLGVHFGDTTHALDGIQGAVTVNAGAGAYDVVSFNDSAATAGQTYTLTDHSLSRNGMASVTFSGVETVDLYGTKFDDNLILKTLPHGDGLGYMGVAHLLGGYNHVYGPNTDNTWTIVPQWGNPGEAILNHGFYLSSISALTGGARSDHFIMEYDSSGNAGNIPDTLDGGGGVNTLDYSQDVWAHTAGNNIGVTVNLGAFGASGKATQVGGKVTHIQNVIGSQYDDLLIGNSTGNVLVGGDGNDSLIAGSGNSILIGGAGADKLIGNAGRRPGFDILIGDATDFDKPTDTNLSVLNAFFSTWQNTNTANYTRQVILLRNTGVTVGATTYRLNRSTVHDDGSADTMVGAARRQGALDWFFRSFGDVMRNYRRPEIWT
jgi:hypothetical protein